MPNKNDLFPFLLPDGRRWNGALGFLDKPAKTQMSDQEVGPVDVGEIDRRMAETGRERLRLLAQMPTHPVAAQLLATGNLVRKVWPGSVWDDKHQRGTGGRANMDYERMGNFAYGATMAAAGVPERVALSGAGLAQTGSNLRHVLRGRAPSPSAGFPMGAAPYGDDDRDQTAIREGYGYGRSRLKSKP